MNVINIRKDGTVIEDMSKVEVPKEIVQAIMNLKGEKNEKLHES